MTLGVVPDAWTLNTVLSAYCAAGAASEAYAFLAAEFPKHGLVPGAVAYRSLMRLHLRQHRTDRLEGVLSTMRALGVAPDRDCWGMLVHARARDWRVKDAIAAVGEMRAAGAGALPNHWAALLRARCKALGVTHADVPAHPLAWQFSPRAMRARRATGTGVRKTVALGLRHRMAGGMRV